MFDQIPVAKENNTASPSNSNANPKLFYVICDGFPDPQLGLGRVVEVEDENGVSVSETTTGAKWERYRDGLWRLGPFTAAPKTKGESD